MHKVKYYIETIFVWDCPHCETIMKDDYEPEDELICDNCGEKFEPEKGGLFNG